MGGVRVLRGEALVEPALGSGEHRGRRQPEPGQAMRADRDEERLDRLDPMLEIRSALTDEVSAGQRREAVMRIRAHESKDRRTFLGRREELDLGVVAVGRGQPRVTGDERSGEQLSEGHVHRVVRAERVPQLPRAF